MNYAGRMNFIRSYFIAREKKDECFAFCFNIGGEIIACHNTYENC
jgi:hypothetical protein